MDKYQLKELNAARREGHRFIKVYLHPERIGINQAKVMISGAIALKGFEVGSGSFGATKFEFTERRGESMVFNFDETEMDYICYLYDDPGPGYFSKTGYNRDLLASHASENYFIIKDPEVLADIEERVEQLQKNPNKKYSEIKGKGKAPDTVDELDKQISFLQNRKSMIEKTEQKKKDELEKKKKAVQKIKADKAAALKIKEGKEKVPVNA